MPGHGREMRQIFTEYISKLFVRQQMKDESWESTVRSQKKNVFSFWKTLLFLFSLASLSVPTSVPTYSTPIFSLGSIRQSLLQAQVSIPSVFEGIHLSHAYTLLGVLVLHASPGPHASQASTQQNN